MQYLRKFPTFFPLAIIPSRCHFAWSWMVALETVRPRPSKLVLSDTLDKWRSPAIRGSARRQRTRKRFHSLCRKSFLRNNCDFKMVNLLLTVSALIRLTRHSFPHRQAPRHTLDINQLRLLGLDITTRRPPHRKRR